ncbi:hypothetical protein OS493_033340 [Desmophyllum pertusum]|uniref:Protein rolling stone n=1 Tax=Desmophyllum pertusum TaxID=174260 RepID=A0A9W9Z8B2_9CNID|nr:hypothetical protein OS493_033340 [Desmophyllum pertusum]
MCREEFRLRNFKFWHPEHREFTDSRWLSLPVFIAYRLIVTVYNLAWLFYNIHVSGVKLFIFLTNWTYLILNIYFVYATTLSCIALYRDNKKSRETDPVVEIEMGPGDDHGGSSTQYGATDLETADRKKDGLRFQHKLLWLIYVISATGGLWITVGYWSILIEDAPIDANNITKHALNSVFMLIDTCLSSIPVQLFHFLYVLLYFLIYIAFSVFYWLLGGTNNKGQPYIYRLLNYSEFKATTGVLLAVFLLLVLPVLHLVFFGITKLRDYIYRKRVNGMK